MFTRIYRCRQYVPHFKRWLCLFAYTLLDGLQSNVEWCNCKIHVALHFYGDVIVYSYGYYYSMRSLCRKVFLRMSHDLHHGNAPLATTVVNNVASTCCLVDCRDAKIADHTHAFPRSDLLLT